MNKWLLKLEIPWRRFRVAHPARLYQYGTIGLHINDDRTFGERICDSIDAFFFDLHRQVEANAAKAAYIFRSYFDTNWGCQINSVADLKRIEKEKKGEYVSVREFEDFKKKKDAAREAAHAEKISAGIRKVIKDVNQGRSFVNEAKEKRDRIYKEYGVKQ